MCGAGGAVPDLERSGVEQPLSWVDSGVGGALRFSCGSGAHAMDRYGPLASVHRVPCSVTCTVQWRLDQTSHHTGHSWVTAWQPRVHTAGRSRGRSGHPSVTETPQTKKKKGAARR